MKTDLTPKAKRAMKIASRLAYNAGDKFIGTDHLLVASISVKNGGAAAILKFFGLDAARVRALAMLVFEESKRKNEIDRVGTIITK